MNIKKAEGRERKRNKRIHGMRVDGASVRLLVRIQIKKSGRGDV